MFQRGQYIAYSTHLPYCSCCHCYCFLPSVLARELGRPSVVSCFKMSHILCRKHLTKQSCRPCVAMLPIACFVSLPFVCISSPTPYCKTQVSALYSHTHYIHTHDRRPGIYCKWDVIYFDADCSKIASATICSLYTLLFSLVPVISPTTNSVLGRFG